MNTQKAKNPFSQDAAAKVFTDFLDRRGFDPLPNEKGNKAIKEILAIDYRVFLKNTDFKAIYQGKCVAILVNYGSTLKNAQIFADAIDFLTKEDGGFGDAFQEFIDEFVVINTTPPEVNDPDIFEYGNTYAEIGFLNFDPGLNLNDDGSFNYEKGIAVGIQKHDPDTGMIISAGVSTTLGVFAAVSGPITPAVMIVGAAIVVGAIVLKKVLKKSC